MLAYLTKLNKIINDNNIDYIEETRGTDKYAQSHLIVYFDGGNFLELPPDVTMHEIYLALTPDE